MGVFGLSLPRSESLRRVRAGRLQGLGKDQNRDEERVIELAQDTYGFEGPSGTGGIGGWCRDGVEVLGLVGDGPYPLFHVEHYTTRAFVVCECSTWNS